MAALTITKPEEEHEGLRRELVRVLQKHSQHLPPQDLLAIASHLVGQILAMQDPKQFNADQLMALVQANIEQGNKEAFENAVEQHGGRA